MTFFSPLIVIGEKCELFYRCLLDAMVHLLSFHPICLTNKLELPDQVFLFLSVSASTKDMVGADTKTILIKPSAVPT